MGDFLLLGIELLEIASLVVLSDGIELIIIEETSEFLHPLTIHPLPAPHIQQNLMGSLVRFLIKLLRNSVIEIHEIVDVDLYPLAFAEYVDELLS